MARVAVVGSYGVGLTFGVKRAPHVGETVVGDLFRTDPGGKGSNQAIGAARLGADASILTAIGRDQFGDGALELWEREGVGASAVVRAELPTMVGAILVEPSGDNRIVIVPGALTALTPAHVDAFAEEIAVADVLLVQLEIPVETAHRALAVGRDAGVRTILNPAPAPTEPLAAEMVTLADYATPNETEARALASGAAGTLVVTMGAAGARIGSDLVAAFPANPVDTTGAGDAFNAAFAVALAEGQPDVDAVRWGCAAGAHMVEHPGVVPGLPTRAELEQRLEAPVA
jgi:ribokinase